MNWLSKYYDRRTDASAENDFLRHVGHTESGLPISDVQFQTMIEVICTRLELGNSDRLLDLGCGNGVFTQELARKVGTVVGLDFSSRLIEVAIAAKGADNITYALHDVKRLAGMPHRAEGKFSKVLMNAALQHFSVREFEQVLRDLLTISSQDRVMLFAFVPDAEKKASFDAALQPDLNLRFRRLLGRDLINGWWKRKDVITLCDTLGLNVEFLPVDSSLDGSRYRFDIRIW